MVVSEVVRRGSAQQKDNLCGPFNVARVLIESGVFEWDHEPIDEDLIAMRAGTVLPDSNTTISVPPGAVSRTGYRHQLSVAPVESSGTSAASLVMAVEVASRGALACVPIRGLWSAERVERLVAGAPEFEARLIANVRTGRLWGSRPPLDVLLDELAGRPVQDPAADWDVGHFVELEMLLRGPERSLVVVRDSYPSLGWEGRHLQPPRVVAAALLRGDGREGGVLGVVQSSRADVLIAHVRQLGLETGAWNNGTRS
ncbi:MAG: DUF6885 family protein [Candidatus Dormibacterales bacterium]